MPHYADHPAPAVRGRTFRSKVRRRQSPSAALTGTDRCWLRGQEEGTIGVSEQLVRTKFAHSRTVTVGPNKATAGGEALVNESLKPSRSFNRRQAVVARAVADSLPKAIRSTWRSHGVRRGHARAQQCPAQYQRQYSKSLDSHLCSFRIAAPTERARGLTLGGCRAFTNGPSGPNSCAQVSRPQWSPGAHTFGRAGEPGSFAVGEELALDGVGDPEVRLTAANAPGV
jgi:hypothetical protein